MFQSIRRWPESTGGPWRSTAPSWIPTTRISPSSTVIAQGDQLIGFLEIPCYNGIPTQEDSDTIAFLADVIFLHLKKELRYMGTPQDMLDFFIADLLEGHHAEPAYIQERCNHFHWYLDGDFRVISISGMNIHQSLRTRRSFCAN